MNGEHAKNTQSKPTRLAGFANFFKGYMSVSTVVAASIPIPITSWKLIPIYAQQRGFLTVYASLFCFLLLAFVFSIRHRLAAPMFFKSGLSGIVAALPAVFIALTLGCVIGYHAILQYSIGQLHDVLGFSNFPTKDLLEQMDATQIPYAVELAACYLGIFIFAELAFVLMAIREYLQDALRLDEVELLHGKAQTRETVAEPEGIAEPESTRASG
jgi:hypothetical protein